MVDLLVGRKLAQPEGCGQWLYVWMEAGDGWCPSGLYLGPMLVSIFIYGSHIYLFMYFSAGFVFSLTAITVFIIQGKKLVLYFLKQKI